MHDQTVEHVDYDLHPENRAPSPWQFAMSIRLVAFGNRCCILDYQWKSPESAGVPVVRNSGRQPARR
jgi:hypothetical protein